MKLRPAIYISTLLPVLAFSQASVRDKIGRPSWVTEPKSIVSSANDVLAPELRAARSARFNSSVGVPLDVDQPDSEKQVFSAGFNDFSRANYMPVEGSDVIVVGRATSFQPFFSADHKRIYTDLSFTPTQVLKNAPSAPVAGKLELTQEGGSLKLPSGETVTSLPYGGSRPIALSTDYLLFLKYRTDLKTFIVLQAWDLSSGSPVADDPDGNPIPAIFLANRYGIVARSQDDLIVQVKSKL